MPRWREGASRRHPVCFDRFFAAAGTRDVRAWQAERQCWIWVTYLRTLSALLFFCAEASLFAGGRLFSPILLLSLFLRSATYCVAAMVLMVSNMSLAQASSRRTCALWSLSRLAGMAKVVLSDSMRAGCSVWWAALRIIRSLDCCTYCAGEPLLDQPCHHVRQDSYQSSAAIRSCSAGSRCQYSVMRRA